MIATTKFFTFFILLLLACKNNNEDRLSNQIKDSLIELNQINLDKFELVLLRGAFHYDKFELIGNELRYIPSKDFRLKDHPQYSIESKAYLSDSQVLNIIKELNNHNIYELDSIYQNVEIDSLGNILEFSSASSSELIINLGTR